MPRSSVETPLTGSAGPALDDLLKRGRAQGRLSLDEVRRMIAGGDILDMKTVAGIALLR